MTSGPIIVRNRFAGRCKICTRLCRPGEGVAEKSFDRWQVTHDQCAREAETERKKSKRARPILRRS